MKQTLLSDKKYKMERNSRFGISFIWIVPLKSLCENMWGFKVFGLVALLAVGALAFEGIELEERILDSAPARRGQFGYVVQLAEETPYRPSRFCSGALINSRTILTTARCVTGRTSNLRGIVVLSGSFMNSQGRKTPISKILIHEGFNATSVENDIALVRTAQAIQYTVSVRDVLLPTELARPNTTVVNAGWGSTTVSSAFNFCSQFVRSNFHDQF